MNMPEMDRAAFQALVAGWIVKKSPSSAPQRLTEEDFAQLEDAAWRSWWAGQAGAEENPAEKAMLKSVTEGWIVQRERGGIPGPLGEEDFRAIMNSLKPERVPPAVPEPVVEAEPEAVSEPDQPVLQPLPADANIKDWRADYMPDDLGAGNDVLPDGRAVRDVLKEDPFYFARLHLALSL
ncbi:hypothetical protein CO583_09050 [Parasaccharibacter sp. TMW2.1882]|uniref:Uncharacterized protein n=1 Tax=Parasaccharibacter apium TaxID=1510841 RepID=A0ABX4ZNN8_9PROT|nr:MULTISPECIES: hypothetical protein [Acetobacteraceae]MCL1563518.1 hypothetical protein [Parasaccharibacter sp. TMW 2.1886]MUH01907.1 hypothetical protein [Bombella sp. ESL0387]MCK8637827.1 hypothetical protein [Parasaccharibacter sp. TMW2.1885]MCL1497645.1 hypothetical protein [Parasaccharibacter sp. TMW2.1882]MCL1514263.1 hypothetical protein [Parasaccharibacter sp. TMW 2.1891]